ncbi:hypothetical protein [Methylobacterium isbiliense]|jgi:hypothetical protein|uniref:Uncharacterized protein n=1 Tax=Methylobacterium isbiliense TaxID=315478 RepID=A0ABQ4S9X8_9HYPH|nr:hypothetical protein [Methylobacterium isbiliense]MDN3621810.1 hypothetical protein [Methylobacterium isbiliense]GJD99911.1 hypothetical protein GMJLKIPL_1829 [Methylobacterium isbiliense]
MRPLVPLVQRLAPSLVTPAQTLGRAMPRIVESRADRFVLESADINRLGR